MTYKQYPYLVSVLMPAYNASLYIREAIDSILSQTFSDFEFLIIDDGSTDNTVDIVKSYNDTRIKLLQNGQNKGLVYTLNKGLDIAQGKYIARMDADDISKPDRLEKQFAYLESSSDVDILGTAFNFLDTPYEIHHPVYNEDIRIRLLDDNAFAHPTVMFRAETLRKNNLYYKSEYKHVEDYHFWTQAAIKELGLANLDEVLLLYRQHPTQVTTSKFEEQQHLKNSIRLEYLKHYFGSRFSNNELMTVLDGNNVGLADYVLLLNELEEINKQRGIFYDKYFARYVDTLIYRKVMYEKKVASGEIYHIMKNNVSLHIKKTILKIKLKSIFVK